MKFDRLTWIVLACCAVVLGVNIYFTNQNQKIVRQQEVAKKAEQQAVQVRKETTGETTAQLTVEAPPPPAEEQLVDLRTSKVIFMLTNHGGGVKYADFRDQFQVGSKDAMVRVNRFGAGAIGSIFGEGQALDNIIYTYRGDQSVPGKKAVFVGKLSSGILVKKTFTVLEREDAKQPEKPGEQYMLDLDVEVENPGPTAVNLSQWGMFLGEASPVSDNEDFTQTGFFWRANGKMSFETASAFKGGWFSSEKSVISSDREIPVQFAGLTNQFFTTVIQPVNTAPSDVWGRTSQIKLTQNGKSHASVNAGIRFPAALIQPGAEGRRGFEYRIFIGPKHNPLLRKMNSAWGDGWGDVMQYGFFSPISRVLNWLLNTYHHGLDKVAKHWSWGLAIILLTITVRLVIWPLHAKSTHTMKRMAKLKPEMDKLKEKYPDDPNKLNTEMMGLYRKFGINPVGGCLPMFLQIPIFFGFFRMLGHAVELRGQPFLWVKDLSQPDTIVHLSSIPINLLPIVMAITSFVQIKMTPSTGDKMQQRIILFMPFMFFFFCYNYASALALYWTVQNIFSIGQTWLMSKVPEPELKPVQGGGKKSWVQRMAEQQAEMQRRQKEGGMRDVTPVASKKPRGPRTGG